MSIIGWYKYFRLSGNGAWASIRKAAAAKQGKLTEVAPGSCLYTREVRGLK